MNLSQASKIQDPLKIMIRLIVAGLCVIVIALVIITGLGAGKAKARDERRLTDVDQISKALKVYYENNLRYPESVGGVPKDITAYLQYWPQAPTPADGTCTRQANSYVYTQLDNGQSYELSFCLGQETKGYQAGFYQIKP